VKKNKMKREKVGKKPKQRAKQIQEDSFCLWKAHAWSTSVNQNGGWSTRVNQNGAWFCGTCGATVAP